MESPGLDLDAAGDSGAVRRFDAHVSVPLPTAKMLLGYLRRLQLDPGQFPGSSARVRPGCTRGSPAAPREELLRTLLRAHLCAVPYTSHSLVVAEAPRGASLISHIYRKLLLERQGGTSLESNILLAWALELLLQCHVDFLEASMLTQSSEGQNLAHSSSNVILLVHLDSGAWLVDATGGAFLAAPLVRPTTRLEHPEPLVVEPGLLEPLMLEHGVEQVYDCGRFRVITSPVAGCGARECGSQLRMTSDAAESPQSTHQSTGSHPFPGCAADRDTDGMCSPHGMAPAELSAVVSGRYILEAWLESQERGGALRAAEEEQSSKGQGGLDPGSLPGWRRLFSFSTWPLSKAALWEEECKVAGRCAGYPRLISQCLPESQGGGRRLLFSTHMLLSSADGRLKEAKEVCSPSTYCDLLLTHFSIPVNSQEERPRPVHRDPPRTLDLQDWAVSGSLATAPSDPGASSPADVGCTSSLSASLDPACERQFSSSTTNSPADADSASGWHTTSASANQGGGWHKLRCSRRAARRERRGGEDEELGWHPGGESEAAEEDGLPHPLLSGVPANASVPDGDLEVQVVNVDVLGVAEGDALPHANVELELLVLEEGIPRAGGSSRVPPATSWGALPVGGVHTPREVEVAPEPRDWWPMLYP